MKQSIACLLLCSSFALAKPDTSGLRSESRALKPLVTTALAHAFLDATFDLPPIPTRTIVLDQKSYLADEHVYYGTQHGTPLAYTRAVELLGRAGFGSFDSKRVFDYGFGSIGQLRLFAQLGADVVGVEVNPFLKALYNDSDQGSIPRAQVAGAGSFGRLHLIFGDYPSDLQVVDQVGSKLDLIVSKNVLKYGYLHPARPVDDDMLIHTKVSDEVFVQTLYDALNPGGYVMIYNLAPRPSRDDEPYIPWSDPRCPFAIDVLARIGFEVVVYNRDDSNSAREMGRALKWDQGKNGMNLEQDLFAQYTLLRKPSN